MFCPQCGKKCPDDSRFCEHCGSPITPAPAPAPTPFSAPAPAPAPVPRPGYVPITPPPVQLKKKSHAGLIVVIAVLAVLLAAAGGGAFFVMQLRSDNEAALSDQLMDHMWERCQEKIVDYYDDALSKPYSEKGYKIDRESSDFSLRPTDERDVFSVRGSVDVVDRTVDGASYEVEIEGTATTDFLRKKFTGWDLEYHFEEPPARKEEAPAEEPAPETAAGQPPASDAAQPDTAPAEEADAYLWPTDSQYITDADLASFTQKEVMLMRNELYARYGCSFRDEEIRTYFESQSWYIANPDLLAVDFPREWFNEYETANLDTILNYEKAMGWRK